MANEKRLIDANELIRFIENERDKISASYNREDRALANAFKLVAKNIRVFPTAEANDMREFAEDVVCQFGYYCQNGGRLHITHGGLSTLEWAFDILGWENPHPVPEFECEIEGCHEHATCGTPTDDGYKRMCGMHYRNHCAKMDGDGNG